MQRILVTGGAGYIGSGLVPALLAAGYEVRVLDNLMYGQTSLLPYFLLDGFEFVLGDIRDRNTVIRALDGVDFVVHLAAIVGAPACKRDPGMAKEINCDATILLSDCMSASQGLVFASTGSNYGAVEEMICTEATPLNPLSEYGTTKTAAEMALLMTGTPIIYRYATAFGLSQRLRLDLLVNDLTFRAVRDKQLVIYEANFRRTFIHVHDMAQSLIHALKHFNEMSGNVYNVGHDRMNYTKREVVAKIQEKTGCAVDYSEVGTDPDQRDYVVSYYKIRASGFESAISLESGIDELVKAFPMIFQEGSVAKGSGNGAMANVPGVGPSSPVANVESPTLRDGSALPTTA